MKTKKIKISSKEFLLSLLIVHFGYGITIWFMYDSFEEIIIGGLYHKILFGFPIGVLFMTIISSIFAVLTYLIIIMDIQTFKKYELREKSLNYKGENP